MENNNLSQTLIKGLEVLECVVSANSYLTAMQVAEKCDLSRTTAYRLLVTLEERDYVVRVNESHFKVGPAAFALSSKELEKDDLPTIAKPFLTKLNEKTGETALLTKLIGHNVVSIARVESSNNLRIGSSIGTIYPSYCTAMGKAIFAFLGEKKQNELISEINLVPRTEKTITDKQELLEHLKNIFEQGYAIDDGESEENIKCIFAPIFNSNGEVNASIGFSGIAFRVNKLDQIDVINSVISSAKELSKMIGYRE